MYEPYIGKAIGDHIHGLKTRMNNHITVYIGIISLIALKEITNN